jgi:hypothetical protein
MKRHKKLHPAALGLKGIQEDSGMEMNPTLLLRAKPQVSTPQSVRFLTDPP